MLATAISLTTFKLWFQSNICTCIARIHSIHIRRHQGAYQIRLFSSLLTNHHSNPSISYTHIYILSHPRPSLLFWKPQFSHHANKIRHKLVWRRNQCIVSLRELSASKCYFIDAKKSSWKRKTMMMVVDIWWWYGGGGFLWFPRHQTKKKNPPSLDWRR